jgi:oxygen-independent coproporphyrinogen-3 oxidase
MSATGTATCEADDISLRMQAVETMIQRLRLRDGIDCESFEDRFGVHPAELFNGTFGELVDLGLLEQASNTIRPTTRGFHLASEIALKVLP